MQPAQKLIVLLDQLRGRLSSSGTERTAGLLEAMGDDCSFYRKSLDIFLRRDYDDIRELITAVQAEFDKLEGN